MTYRVDEETLHALDAEMRDAAAPLGGGGRVVTATEVQRWWQEAKEAQTLASERLAALAREVGWSAIVEALLAHGVLHDDRFDDWY